MTIYFDKIFLKEYSVVAGPFLYNGPLNNSFDSVYKDFYDGEKTFEDCEIKELKKCISILLKKINNKKIDLIISADLSNQLTISSFAIKKFNIPFLGVYNACASFVEEVLIASNILTKKNINNIICTTSAHNLTAERQFRNPIEYGAPKPSYSTFTVSAQTSCLITKEKSNIRIESVTIGTITDYNIKDSFDMGSVMASSCAETLHKHLIDTNRSFDYYDLIISGDLGKYGKEIMKKYYLSKYNVDLNNYDDSAVLVYDMNDKRVLAGGSGPSCLPSYFFSKIAPLMNNKKIKKVLLLATGALFNTTSVNQKKSIPSICHALSLEVL